MSALYVICMAIAAVLGFLAGAYRPATPPPVNLLGLAVGFLALAFVLQNLAGGR